QRRQRHVHAVRVLGLRQTSRRRRLPAAVMLRAGAATLLLLLCSATAAAQRTPRHGTVRGDAFYAASLGVTKHLLVYLPPSYATTSKRRYPVVYYLHGLSGRESDWLSVGAIDAVADSLIAAGMHEVIIVLPDGDDSW